MKPQHTFVLVLVLILLGLALGGCRTQSPSRQAVDVEYTLKTTMLDGSLAFVGVGGEIDGAVNPDLIVSTGKTIRVVIVNGDGMPHDFAIPALNVQTALVSTTAQTIEVVFHTSEAGEFTYFCTVAGHRQLGMEGNLIIREP